MLSYLKVENLAVVEKAEITFSPSLNVLTGETGAGKSILIDAIQLLLNKKTPSHMIRQGSDRLLVEALFSRGEEEFLLKREVENGRSLSFLNGEITTFQNLREMTAGLLNIYGQKDHVFLLNTANHQSFLDEYAGHAETLSEIGRLFQSLRRRLQEARELQQNSERANERIGDLAYLIDEIERLGLQPGEEEQLQERLRLLADAETIIQRTEAILSDLYDGEDSVYPLLARRRQDIDFLKGHFADFGPLADEINRFYEILPEISAFLGQIQGKLEFDEGELNTIEQKLQSLESLKRKYKLPLEGILKKKEEMISEKDQLLNLDFALEEKKSEIGRLMEEYRNLNRKIRESRKKTGSKLADKISAELARLEMPKARFEVYLEEIEPEPEIIRENGTDRAEFLFSSNPGQDPAPLASVASGGELSRLMLVLKSLCSNERDTTFIFDEIDSGIGGKTAEFVGEKLRQISKQNQVICISHLPQIASFADRHFLVNKEFRRNQTFSSAVVLKPEERIREIARLMAGSASGEEILKAATALLHKNNPS